jgi:hypothetical protein
MDFTVNIGSDERKYKILANTAKNNFELVENSEHYDQPICTVTYEQKTPTFDYVKNQGDNIGGLYDFETRAIYKFLNYVSLKKGSLKLQAKPNEQFPLWLLLNGEQQQIQCDLSLKIRGQEYKTAVTAYDHQLDWSTNRLREPATNKYVQIAIKKPSIFTWLSRTIAHTELNTNPKQASVDIHVTKSERKKYLGLGLGYTVLKLYQSINKKTIPVTYQTYENKPTFPFYNELYGETLPKSYNNQTLAALLQKTGKYCYARLNFRNTYSTPLLDRPYYLEMLNRNLEKKDDIEGMTKIVDVNIPKSIEKLETTKDTVLPTLTLTITPYKKPFSERLLYFPPIYYSLRTLALGYAFITGNGLR